MLNSGREDGRLRFLRRSADKPRRGRFRRGVYLLPSLLTLGNMFCGYACVVYAMHGEFETAAPFIGFAIVLDMLDGRIARLTGTASAFGVEFDSLADIISFGMAPAILSFAWGLQPLGRLGWAAGFMFVTAAAMRLARFNIQSGSAGDKRYFVGMPSPGAAAVVIATVVALDTPEAKVGPAILLPACISVVPALLMVSTVRFRSFRDLVTPRTRQAQVLTALVGVVFVAGLVFAAAITLLVVAYSYVLTAPLGVLTRPVRARLFGPGSVAPPRERQQSVFLPITGEDTEED
jgi:CDP-diacylglycerol---serine O-phosphatidyltransferase